MNGRDPGFDRYAETYDDALEQGLSVTGEGREYFARGRVTLLKEMLERSGERATRVLDFGCGTGDTVTLLEEAFAPDLVQGVDESERSIAVARRRKWSPRVEFSTASNFQPDSRFDLVYCNGVFHHVQPTGRPGVISLLARSLRKGGILALWENNPWNPGTRLVMGRISFDRDAVLLWPKEALRLVRAGGFEIIRVDFVFLFPRLLRLLRPIERVVTRLPLGAQYQVLCRRL